MADTIPFSSVRPAMTLDLLSQREMASLANSNEAVYRLFRRCALAVLNTGSDSDDTEQILREYRDFDVRVIAEPRGVRLELANAPASAFVDGEMLFGIRHHLFSALRDIIYVQHELLEGGKVELDSSEGITDAVFRILRHAEVVRSNIEPRLIVCWGGHAISREEHDHSKEVGYQLGLRGFDIATGCGPGAMKGPMKGATIGHAKQYSSGCRFVGITEPGIIAAESPNPIVNELVILPDIEKRLEAFVRLAHGLVVFPGGVGTAEELLYLLAIRMHPDNAGNPLPLVMSAPAASAGYFERIDAFLRHQLGDEVARHYRIIIDNPTEVARALLETTDAVRSHRVDHEESFSFNWGLTIPWELQQPFIPTHEAMAALPLHREQPVFELMVAMRRAFSGIVAGNVKEDGMRAVATHGPFQIQGDPKVIHALDGLLRDFASQGRMKIDAARYKPCFRLSGPATG
jgi:predicted Rossmann-fold nucleotide-binding protein